jgi:FHS family glucose/mannose:H+ symporter-like MFS transporter
MKIRRKLQKIALFGQINPVKSMNARIKLSLIINYFLFAILLNSVGTVILKVIENYQVEKAAASVLEGFKDLSIAIVSFLIASFIPRLGYKRSMLIGLAVVAFACISMPLVPSFLTTKILFMCVGMSFALIKVSVYATIGLITNNEREHVSFMNTIEGVFMIGVLTGYWLFSWFIDPADPLSKSWLNVYWILSVFAVLAFFLLWSAPLDESAVKEEGAINVREDFRKMLRLFLVPLIYFFLACAFLYVLIEQGVGTWLPTFNKEILMLPSNMSVQAGSIFAGSLALGRLLAGRITQRISWFPLLVFCIIAMAILVVLTLPLTHNIQVDPNVGWFNAPVAVYVFPLIGLFMAPIYPAINSVMLSSLPKYEHAPMTGLIVVFSALGGTTGSLITGAIFGAFTGQIAFYMTLVPMSLLLVALIAFYRRSKHKVEI